MDLAPKTILISKLLSQILSDAVAFDQERHSKLIELLIDTIKVIEKSGDSLFCSKQAASVLMQIIVDFLYRLKDRHPYSRYIYNCLGNSEMEGTMNVLDIILEFLIPNGYLPSAALFKEYSESELTKNFNTLPPLEYLNSKFDEYYQMSEEAYELLRMRLNSRPPFVFFFNPSIQLQESMNMDSDIYKLGFFAKPYSNQIGAGMYITNYGWMYRGYFYSNSQNIYGKLIYSKEAYKGGWNRGFKDGKGEFEYFQEERVEVGQWVGEFRQGEFECYDNNGRLTHIKIYKNDVEIKKEDVSDEIYRNK